MLRADGWRGRERQRSLGGAHFSEDVGGVLLYQ
jgi:hypothetical protein